MQARRQFGSPLPRRASKQRRAWVEAAATGFWRCDLDLSGEPGLHKRSARKRPRAERKRPRRRDAHLVLSQASPPSRRSAAGGGETGAPERFAVARDSVRKGMTGVADRLAQARRAPTLCPRLDGVAASGRRQSRWASRSRRRDREPRALAEWRRTRTHAPMRTLRGARKTSG